ncbi:MAG: terminase gpA endonuclease subunit [Pirellulales bacterium]
MVPADPLSRLADRIAACWTPTVRRSTAEWCARELRIADDASGATKRFDFSGRAFMRGIFDSIDDPDVDTVAVMGPAQFGKTTFSLAVLGSRPECDPGPGMFAGPDAGYVAEKARLLYRWAELTPSLAGRIPPKHKRRERAEVNFDNCTIYLAWSGSPQTMSGRPVRFLMCSEIDRWTNDAKHGQSIEVIRARVQSFPHSYKIVCESTPTDETSSIAALLEQSNYQSWHCPCPRCGHYQVLRLVPHREGKFAGCGGIVGLQNERGDWLSPEQARRRAYYLCERGCRISSSDKPRMIDAGRWVPKGQSVTAKGQLTGTPERAKRQSGFHVTGLMMHFSWGSLAAQYLAAKAANALRTLWNNLLGLPWKERSKTPKWRDLGRRLTADHRRGLVPAACWFLTAAADVQADRVYWSVRGWGERGTNWLIDWGCVRGKAEGERLKDEEDDELVAPDADLSQLGERIVTRRFAVAGVNPWGQTELETALVGCDSGHRIRHVHQWVRSQRHPKVRAVGGDPKAVAGCPWKASTIDADARTGKPYPGGLQKWWINTDQFKTALCASWQIDPTEPAAWLLPCDILEQPDGEDFLRQVTNERVAVEVSASGKQVRRWKEIDKAVGNHFFDCEVYHAALADMVTGGDFSRLNLDALAAEARKALAPRPKQRGDRPSEPDDFAAR